MEKTTDKMEPDTQNKPPRVGVYICHCGGNISDVVDVEKVEAASAKLPNVVIATRNMFMCSDPGQNTIAEDIQKGKINRVVVAACSPSLHENTFRQTLVRAGLNPYLYEHANIREQVSWVSKSDPEGATDKAIRLVAAAVAKASLLCPLEPIRVQAKQHVAVIGGGISGLRCARDLSSRGFEVTLLEHSPFFGGRMAQLGRVYPTEDNARELLQDLIKEIKEDPKITIHTLAEVIDISDYIGNFNLKVRLNPRGVAKSFNPDNVQQVMYACPETTENEFDYELTSRKAIYLPYKGCYPDIPAIDWETCTKCGKCADVPGGKEINLDEQAKEIKLNVGVIIVATGFDHYEPKKGEYGYKEYPEVITLPQLIRLLDEQGPTRGKLAHNGKPVKNLCFIHCVGSRQIEGVQEPGPDGKINNYCSRVCCTATLQAANEIKERFPEVNLYSLYQDIRTYGRGHEDYYEKASKQGVLFFRYLPESPPVVVKNESKNDSSFLLKVKDTLTWQEELEIPTDMVVLSTGMMPHNISNLIETLKLPRSADGFLQEVHPKLRPVELAVSGVLIAGTCQAPMDINESCSASSAAAAKASSILAKGYIELDPFVVKVDSEKCEACGTCVQECKFSKALSLIESEIMGNFKTIASVNPALCGGCGMCSAVVCPNGAIKIEGWQVDQFEAMVDAIVADY